MEVSRLLNGPIYKGVPSMEVSRLWRGVPSTGVPSMDVSQLSRYIHVYMYPVYIEVSSLVNILIKSQNGTEHINP